MSREKARAALRGETESPPLTRDEARRRLLEAGALPKLPVANLKALVRSNLTASLAVAAGAGLLLGLVPEARRLALRALSRVLDL